MTQIRILGAILIGIIFSSCAQYIDKHTMASGIPSDGTGLLAHKEYNVFKFKPTYKLTKDEESIIPQSFEIRLPKGLRYYSGSNGSDFGFYYDSGQVLFVKTGNEFVKSAKIYEPSSKELESIIDNKLITSKAKFNIKEIKAHPGRNNLVVKTKDALILLYNVKIENINGFKESANSYKSLY